MHPFHALLGVEILEAANGRARVRLSSRNDLLNVRGTIHGGAIAALADIAIGLAARSAAADQAMVTVSLSINFLSAATETVTAEAITTRVGRALASGEVHVRKEDGTLAAHAIGTFQIAAARGSQNTSVKFEKQ